MYTVEFNLESSAGTEIAGKTSTLPHSTTLQDRLKTHARMVRKRSARGELCSHIDGWQLLFVVTVIPMTITGGWAAVALTTLG